MRTFLSFTAVLVLAPTLAFAQEAPPAAPAAPEAPSAAPEASPAAPAAPAAAPVTVVVLPPAAPMATPPGYAAPLAPVAYAPLAPDPVVMRRRNPKLMVGGLVMLPLGLGMLIGGLAWAAQINGQPSKCNPSAASSGDLGANLAAPFCAFGEGLSKAMGSGLAYSIGITGGGIALAGGIMTGVGASMVPAKPRWMPQPAVGAGTASLTWTF